MKKRKKPKPYCPVFLDLEGKKCVVIGGGEVALRKVRMLLECGADIAVISPAFHPNLWPLAKNGSIRVIQRPYKTGDLRGAVLVIAATGRRETNRKISREAGKKRIWINVADDPERSDFIVPSFFRRGGLTIAVSTSGMSPALARKIRTKLEQDFGEEYQRLLSLIEEVRSMVKQRKIRVSNDVWQEALNVDLLIGLVRKGQHEEVKKVLMGKLEKPRRD